MSTSNERQYGWLLEGIDSPYTNAACVTLATVSPNDALSAIGADPDRYVPVSRAENDDPSVAALATASIDGRSVGVALLEPLSWQGARPAVLALLSRSGRCASAYWDASGLVSATGADRGRIRLSVDLPSTGEPPALIPGRMRRMSTAPPGIDPRATALELIVGFTGLALATDLRRSALEFHPILEPVVALPFELSDLVQLPAPWSSLVLAVADANESGLRMVAQQAAVEAINAAGALLLPGVRETLDDLARDHRVTTLSMRFENTLRAADRASMQREQASRHDADLDTSMGARPTDTYWALQTLAYAGARDARLAALGSCYCASIRLNTRPNELSQYLSERIGLLQVADG
jgi:hypothetical protein